MIKEIKKPTLVIGAFIILIIGCGVPAAETQLVDKDTLWTCSMHPQVKLPEPGRCPFCNMDLIPLEKPKNLPGDDPFFLATATKALAKIETVVVKKDLVAKQIYLSGRVVPDASLMKNVSARVDGRLEKMYISFVGTQVRKGDHLYRIYSPDLVQAQQSLIQSKRRYELAQAKSQDQENASFLESSRVAYRSAKEKLRLYGFATAYIESLAAESTFKDFLDIYSEHQGVVMSKKVEAGDYVQVGTVIYELADLSTVWVVFDVYEQDIPWVRYGEKITVKFPSWSGQEHRRRIAYVSPMLAANSRTAQIRVSLPNSNLLIKPGMFAEGLIRAELTEAGLLIDNELADKYISPMHPEIIRQAPGVCPVCGTPLVKAAELGYTFSSQQHKKIIIPKSAPLITGKRAVVYVEEKTAEGFFYQLREVVLGPRTGDYYVVEAGLAEEEKVVSQGAFVIDSARELEAKQSMMKVLLQEETAGENEN